MKKMKKNNKMIFGIMMAVVMMLGLVACGKDGSSDTTPTTTETTTEAVETTTDEVVTNNDATEVTTETTTEEVVEAKYKEYGYFDSPDGTMKIHHFVSIDGTTSYNIVEYNGTSKVNFAFTGPADMGTCASEIGDHITISTKANDIAIKYYWDTTAGANEENDSDDSDYVRMLTNGQFKYYFTDYNDSNDIGMWFVEIQILEDGEVQNAIDTNTALVTQ